MEERNVSWDSPRFSKGAQILVFGHSGKPVLMFPTSMGIEHQYRDFGLIGQAAPLLDAGKLKIFCVNSADEMSWYNKGIHPSDRVKTHDAYFRMIREEVYPFIVHETGYERIAVAGASFGGYHAANFAFRYPEITSAMISMGGAFDIANQLDGYFDELAYFHNPVSYLPDLQNDALYRMGIILGIGEHDFLIEKNYYLSHLLSKKGVAHWLDIRAGYDHDWPGWKAMWWDYIWKLAE